ncbi:hypothetical protein QOT17_010097 [Balamuthia mandrillaris]
MLRINKVLDIHREVFPRIPQERLWPPTNPLLHKSELNEMSEAMPDPKACRLSIIGQEKGGVILFTYDGFISNSQHKRTFIVSYNLNTREMVDIYCHPSPITIVDCSLNEDKTLMVYTTLTRYRKTESSAAETQDFEDIYETTLVEVQTNKIWNFDIKSKARQSVYFLGSKSTRWNRHEVYLLFVLHGHFIHIFQLNTVRRSTTEEQRISRFPFLHTRLAQKEQLAWHQYEDRKSLLFALTYSSTKDSAPPKDYKLHCWKFTQGKKYESIFEISQLQLDALGTPEVFATTPFTLFGSFDRRASSPSLSSSMDYLQIVQMDNGGACLCQQHPLATLKTSTTSPTFSSSIQVSIFILHHQIKLDIAVPLNTLPPYLLNQVRVFFSCIGDLLMLYVPGYYLQFIDCGREHDPCMGLTFMNAEFAAALPAELENGLMAASSMAETTNTAHMNDSSQPPFITSFDLLLDNVSSIRGRTFIDLVTGTIYEFAFNREAVLRVYQTTDAEEMHIQALHLAIIHLQDVELVDRIMRHICTESPECLTAELVREYLVAMPYQSMKNKNMEVELLRLLPVTSIEGFLAEENQTFHKRGKRSLSRVSKLDFPLGPSTRALISMDKPKQRFVSPLYSTSLDGHNNPSVRNLFYRILGLEEDNKSPTSSPKGLSQEHRGGAGNESILVKSSSSLNLSGLHSSHHSSSSLEQDRWRFVETLAQYMNSNTKENKSKCLAWAKYYREEQLRQCNLLFEYISPLSEEDESKTSQHLFEDGEGFVSLSGVAPPELNTHKPTFLHSSVNASTTLDGFTKFRVMENIYYTLEDLAFPTPKGFDDEFVMLGFKHLPRHVFLQYVERGIFYLSPQFVYQICDNLMVKAHPKHPSSSATSASRRDGSEPPCSSSDEEEEEYFSDYGGEGRSGDDGSSGDCSELEEHLNAMGERPASTPTSIDPSSNGETLCHRAIVSEHREDYEFKFKLICQLRGKDFMRGLQRCPENVPYLLEYCHSVLPLSYPSVQDLTNPKMVEKSNQRLQSTNHSAFLPATIFLSDLNEQQSSRTGRTLHQSSPFSPPASSGPATSTTSPSAAITIASASSSSISSSPPTALPSYLNSPAPMQSPYQSPIKPPNAPALKKRPQPNHSRPATYLSSSTVASCGRKVQYINEHVFDTLQQGHILR